MRTLLKTVKVSLFSSFYAIYGNGLTMYLTMNLISRWCIPEATDDVVRVKCIHNSKLSSFSPSLSVSPNVDLIKFGTSWTSILAVEGMS